jgi:CBS domain-containing protein
VPFFGTGLIAGLWLAFIGWFVSGAAVMSYRQLMIKHLLEGVPVSRLMRRLPSRLDANQSVSSFVEMLMNADEQVFAVTAGDELFGLVTAKDVRKIPHGEWDTTPLRAIASRLNEFETASPSDAAYDIVRRLGRSSVHDRIVVIATDGELRGIVRSQDVARWIELQVEDEHAGTGTHRWAGSPR